MIDDAAKNLLRIKDKIDNTNPSFLAVITGTDCAYIRKDGVHVVPIGCLKN